MVCDKMSGGPKKTTFKTSPVRTSSRIKAARFQPTARDVPVAKTALVRNLNQTWPTVYKLDTPGQHPHTIGANQSRPCPAHLLQGLKNFEYPDGTKHHITSLGTQRNERSVLDKVEDMDIDNQSDQESTSVGHDVVTAVTTNSNSSRGNSSGVLKERLVKISKESKNRSVRGKELKKSNANETPAAKLKRKMHENVDKNKPVYIILHASLLRVGQLEGKALKPVRIQAGKILIEMELQSEDKEVSAQPLTLRIPCKEFLAVKVNIFEPPFLFVVNIKQNYSKTLVNNSKKMINKLNGNDELRIIVHLMYDIIPDDLHRNFNVLQNELEPDVRWDEISSIKAEEILSGHIDTEDSEILTKDVKEACLEREEKQETKGNATTEPEPKNYHTSKENKPDIPLNHKDLPQRPLSPVIRCHRKRTYDETTPKSPKQDDSQLEERVSTSEEKTESQQESSDHLPKVNFKATDRSGTRRVNGFRYSPLTEGSSEEESLDDTRVHELETNIAEKESLLTQQRRTLELRDLQLQQERDIVRALRASLRDEQHAKRELEARYEAINNEMLLRETSVDSRVQDLERELSELDLSLSSSRSENQRLAQEIHQVRDEMSGNEETLRRERERLRTLENEIESERTTLERLREELRQKDADLREERARRTAAADRNRELEHALLATREEYEARIARESEEHARTQREHEQCNNLLVSTREQLQDANRGLHRAQETVDEYSRMQPRDWTILRDEIVISEKVLGQGAWGWVKEGRFRGTLVAVKQMHELIVSPHNRRLFEREMQIAARCRHPNLLQFIGATNDNGLALLVTELLDTDLRTVLGQRSLCQDEVVTIATDVSRALNYLHLNKPFPIIHRDISSTNVLLWKREDAYRAKLSDYGAANFMRQYMTVSPGACIYAAPEAVTSRQSTKVDVYSFGLLLCEMCIRELPVPGQNHMQIRAITNAHLRDLVQRSTNEIPDQRPTMAEVLTALLRLRSNAALGTVSINNRHVLV